MSFPLPLLALALGTNLWLWSLQKDWPRLSPIQRRRRTLVGLAFASWTYASGLAWIMVVEAARQAGIALS